MLQITLGPTYGPYPKLDSSVPPTHNFANMSDDAESGGDYDLEGYGSDDSPDPGLDDNGFFDMEAVESGVDSDEPSDDSSSDDSQHVRSPLPLESDHIRAPSSFPQFMQLPPELRHYIWSLFCPDLVAKSRVLEVEGNHKVNPRLRKNLVIGAFLQEQTAPARAVLATHRESRALALRTYPDTLPIHDGDGVVRFNKDTDVVLFDQPPTSILENIYYLGMGPDWGFDEDLPPKDPSSSVDPRMQTLLQTFPNLKAVYFYDEFCNPARMPWLKADKLNFYHFQTYEQEPGLGEDLDFIFCWPDPASNAVPLEVHDIPAPDHANEDYHDASSNDGDVGPRRLRVFELLQFDVQNAVGEFNRLMEWRRSGGELDWEAATSSESDSETNEYESEGIDDDEVDVDSQGSSEDDDLAVLPPSEDESEEAGSVPDHISISSSGSDMGEGEGGLPRLASHTVYPVATFSSPEPGSASSSTLENGEPESSSSEESPVRMVNRAKRRIVSSDLEDDSDGGPVSRSERPPKRARVVLSDSEEENED